MCILGYIWMMRLSVLAWGSEKSRYSQTFVCTQQELLPCKSHPETLFQLLGLSIATLSTVAHYGHRFTLISNISLDSNAYKVIHHSGMLWSHPSEIFGDTSAAKFLKAVEENSGLSQEEEGVGFWRMHQD